MQLRIRQWQLKLEPTEPDDNQLDVRDAGVEQRPIKHDFFFLSTLTFIRWKNKERNRITEDYQLPSEYSMPIGYLSEDVRQAVEHMNLEVRPQEYV